MSGQVSDRARDTVVDINIGTCILRVSYAVSALGCSAGRRGGGRSVAADEQCEKGSNPNNRIKSMSSGGRMLAKAQFPLCEVLVE